MIMVPADIAAIQRLRSDLALQLARYTQRLGVTQSVAAKRLGLPQPTLRKIINGRVADLSHELLIRVAVRARLPITLQTGLVPQEAGCLQLSHSFAFTHSFPIQARRCRSPIFG